MSKFMFIYHGGSIPETPEEQARVMGMWNAWYGEMGDAVLDGGGPAGMSRTVSSGGISDNGGDNPVSGLTIVEAADQDAACEMARGCPMVVEANGTVEVAEVIQM